MNKEFIPYEQALELKELGFNEHCFGEWQNLKIGKNLVVDEEDRIYDISVLGADINAPTFSQAFRWFREKHKIISVIDFHCYGDNWEDVVHEVRISEFEHFKTHDSFIESEYKTYEEAELACLKKLIDILKGK
jgi:hypothetical protein